MLSDKASILHICIPWGKTFSLVSKSSVKVKFKFKFQGRMIFYKMVVGGIHLIFCLDLFSGSQAYNRPVVP